MRAGTGSESVGSEMLRRACRPGMEVIVEGVKEVHGRS